MLTRPYHEREIRELEKIKADCDLAIEVHSKAIDELNRGTNQGADLAIAVEALTDVAHGLISNPRTIASIALEKMEGTHNE